jgi:hypothetical protein
MGPKQGGNFNGPNPCHYILSTFKWGGGGQEQKEETRGGGTSFSVFVILSTFFPVAFYTVLRYSVCLSQ